MIEIKNLDFGYKAQPVFKNISLSFEKGNIYQDDFLDVWENRFQPFRDRAWMKTGQCVDCKVFRNCLGGAMHLHQKDQEGILLCHYNKLK